MELTVSISRAKGKVRARSFIITITQSAKVPQWTFETTMVRHVLKLARTS